MNESARKVLKNLKPKIKANLALETGILDELEQEEILTEYQVATIQAEKTNDDQIDKLLYLLPKRGPDAFAKFVDAIRKNFSFLAEMLEDALNTEVDRDDVAENQDCHSCMSPTPPSPCEDDISMESQSPDQLESPVDKTFPSHRVTTNINTIRPLAPVSHTVNTLLQQNLNSLYTKLKTHMTSSSMRELSFSSPEPVSFEMIEELLEDMFKNLDRCYNILDGKDRSASLMTLIIELKASNKDLRNSLKISDDQRNKYAGNVIKLENKCRDKQAQADRLKKENDGLKKDNHTLQKQIQEASSNITELEEKVKNLEEVNENEKSTANESLTKLKSEVEERNTKCQKQLDEIEELSQRIKTANEATMCQHCQKKITHEHNKYRAKLKLLERTSKRHTPPESCASAKPRESQEARRDSDTSSLTEQKILSIMKRQNNPKTLHNHSQTRTDVNETDNLPPSRRARYTEQIRRSRLSQGIVGVRQGGTPVPSMSRTNFGARFLDTVVSNSPMPMASQVHATARHSDESRRKFLSTLKGAKR